MALLFLSPRLIFLFLFLFLFFLITAPFLTWKLYMLVYGCAVLYLAKTIKEKEENKSTSELERPTRMSYPTWGALLHMAVRHSCLNHKIDELSLGFSTKSEKSSPSVSRFSQASSFLLGLSPHICTLTCFSVVPQTNYTCHPSSISHHHLFLLSLYHHFDHSISSYIVNYDSIIER